MDRHIKWQKTKVNKQYRENLMGQRGCVVWLTGLSGSGKSTIASVLEHMLNNNGYKTYLLDGDNIRHGLNSDLGFSAEERNENIRRIAEVAALFEDAGIITIVSFISPYREMRDFAGGKSVNFFEVFIDADIDLCRQRDVKGLYKKADNGEIKNFTGVSAPYEKPLNPRIHIDTSSVSPEQAAETILSMLKEECIID